MFQTVHNAQSSVKAICTPIRVHVAHMEPTDDRPAGAQRLVRARERRKFKTAKAACDYFGWNYNSYIQHERGERSFSPSVAQRYAKALRVSPAWLLTGEGREQLTRIVGRVGANADGAVLYGEGQDTGDSTPIPPGGSEKAVAVEVVGHSMRGLADDGSLIYFEDRRDPPSEDMLGHVVVVGLDTGEVLIKRLLRGSQPGLYDLESLAGPTRADARVQWAAHITAIIPPNQARKIIIRGHL